MAVNTCFETGGNIAPDQQNPQPHRQAPNPHAEYQNQDYEDEGYEPMHHQPRANHPGIIPQRNMMAHQMELEFTDEEKAYYAYKIEKGMHPITTRKRGRSHFLSYWGTRWFRIRMYLYHLFQSGARLLVRISSNTQRKR